MVPPVKCLKSDNSEGPLKCPAPCFSLFFYISLRPTAACQLLSLMEEHALQPNLIIYSSTMSAAEKASQCRLAAPKSVGASRLPLGVTWCRNGSSDVPGTGFNGCFHTCSHVGCMWSEIMESWCFSVILILLRHSSCLLWGYWFIIKQMQPTESWCLITLATKNHT